MPETKDWLPGVSAGQRVYSPYQGHLLPLSGYQPGSHFLATNWLPPLERVIPYVVARAVTRRTTRHEMDRFSDFATVEWE